MRFVGGDAQALFVDQVRGLDPEQCLLVPIDVGKTAAMALVADLFGEIVVDPFGFDLTEGGVSALLAAVTEAELEREAVMVRVGIEAAGRYHRTLMASLRRQGLEVVELNPGAVKEARRAGPGCNGRPVGSRWGTSPATCRHRDGRPVGVGGSPSPQTQGSHPPSRTRSSARSTWCFPDSPDVSATYWKPKRAG